MLHKVVRGNLKGHTQKRNVKYFDLSKPVYRRNAGDDSKIKGRNVNEVNEIGFLINV